jgi:RNA polymerase sigma-70 factor (ECF subfamily)
MSQTAPHGRSARSDADVSDEELLREAAQGREAAIATLFDRYQGIMYGLASRITADPAIAQDAVQEAFLSIWRHASRFDPSRASARSWILAIAHHRAVDAVRRRRPTSALAGDEDLLPPALVRPDLWGEVRQRLDADVVREALSRLAPLQREAIELAYFGGLTQQEIASRTGSPLGTVKSRVRLGLQALRTEIEAIERVALPAAEVGR